MKSDSRTETLVPHSQHQDHGSPSTIKVRVKAFLQSSPKLWGLYFLIKQQLKRILILRYFIYDITGVYRAMYWPTVHGDGETLSAELLFQYHKLEKGLVMPGPRRRFGTIPASTVIGLCERWLSEGRKKSDPVFLGAIETLHAYLDRMDTHGLDPDDLISSRVRGFLSTINQRDVTLCTPVAIPRPRGQSSGFTSFSELAAARRSVRDFSTAPVSIQTLEKAAWDAQLSPSACNRQPCKLRIVSDEVLKRSLLSHQNGNRGFGHLAPHIAVLTSDESCFFNASERHEPYIDGGLFAMSFILSLRDRGVATCCLNWCVDPKTDRITHDLLKLPRSERIIMLIAIGFEPQDCFVPRSPRRSQSDVVLFI